MTATTRPTPEAIAADIYATAQAHKAGVISDNERDRRLADALNVASLCALTDATIRALRTIEAKSAPHGPGTLDVLLAAETADPEAVCDAVDALTGLEPISDDGARATRRMGNIVLSRRAIAALVRALTGAA